MPAYRRTAPQRFVFLEPMDQERLSLKLLEADCFRLGLAVPDADDPLAVNQDPAALLAFREQSSDFASVGVPFANEPAVLPRFRQLGVVDGIRFWMC